MKNKTYTLKQIKQGDRDPTGKFILYKKLKNGRYEKIS